MTPEVGKIYKVRNGERWKVTHYDDASGLFTAVEVSDEFFFFQKNGMVFLDGTPSPLDLIEEINDEASN